MTYALARYTIAIMWGLALVPVFLFRCAREAYLIADESVAAVVDYL